MNKKERRAMIIYNLFPLLAGKITGWEPHFKRAAHLGFNWIFANPIQRPGIFGSFYSIADYFNINPLLIDSACGHSAEEQ